MESFLFQAVIYLGATVIAVPIAARLGLGSVLGYLAAGIAIGPLLHLIGDETDELQHFAEFGVVIMLFLIGLELEPRTLWQMRHKIAGLGGLQVILTTAAITGAAHLLGLDWQTALAVGMMLALSSTAIVLQTMTEKRLIQTQGGRSAFAVLLTQDVAVIPMLALLPLLAFGLPPAEPVHEGAGAAALAFMDKLPDWGVATLTLGVVVTIILAGIYLTRPLFSFIHSSHLPEMYTALALFMVVGIACLMLIVDLSPALGAFLAGVVLANSEFRHELESDLQPFKGLLLGLFFITVGAGMDLDQFMSEPVALVGLALLLMVIKGLVLFALGSIFKLKGRDRWLFTLGLAQAGEFGFVLLTFAGQQRVIGRDLAETIYLVVALTMLFTPLFFIFYEWLSRRMREPAPRIEPDEITEQAPIIIAGVGRFGQVVNRMIQMSGFRATVLDHDLEIIRLMRRFGFKSFLGDPTRPELLQAAGLATARVLIVATDDKDATTRIVRHARRERPDIHIIARARDRVHVYELYQAGADDIVREFFDSSLRVARYALENMGLSQFEAAEVERLFFKMDRAAIRELAELWRPGVPVEDNEAYVARSKQLNSDLEAALIAKLNDDAEEPREKPRRSA